MNWQRIIWISGLLLTLAVAYCNPGIIALDDYSEGIARIIPAQSLSYAANIETTGIRFPFQSLVLLFLSKQALRLGVTDPTVQLQFVLLVVGLFVYWVQTACAVRFFKTPEEKKIALLLTAFYFVLPLVYSRPLIENLSGVFVTLGAYCAYRFHHTQKGSWIIGSVAAITCSSLFRFQAGVVVLGLPLLFIVLKTHRAWATFLLAGITAFGITGILDLTLTGGFHRSLMSYLNYNLKYASSYGTTPFYTFALLFLALSLPPTFFGRYPGFDWKNRYRPLISVLLFCGVFFVSHSLIPHKEERFMVPVLVLFLVLITPLAHYWATERKSRWRTIYFCGLNSVLLFFASFSTPQNNVISLVQYLNRHVEIKRVLNYQDSLVLIPRAFSLRSFEVEPLKQIVAVSSLEIPCDTVVAVRQDIFAREPWWDNSFTRMAEFKPGILEALLVKLNPRQNSRRGSVFLFNSPHCSADNNQKDGT